MSETKPWVLLYTDNDNKQRWTTLSDAHPLLDAQRLRDRLKVTGAKLFIVGRVNFFEEL